MDPQPRPVDRDLASVRVGQWFSVTARGLEIRGMPPLAAFAELGEALRTFERTLAFVIGDWINALEDRYGEEASQVIDASGWSLNTIRTYAWTAKKVPPENRRIDEGLTYAHHQAVGALEPAEQRHWLTLALGNGDDAGPWPVSRLRAAIFRGSDLAAGRWWVMVECRDAGDQAALVKTLELQGRTCKPLERR